MQTAKKRKRAPVKPSTAESSSRISKIFSGSRSKWLPLFHRLLARLTQLGSINPILGVTTLTLVHAEPPFKTLGQVRVTPLGLELGLRIPSPGIKSPRLKAAAPKSRISHWVLLTCTSDIDAELLSWIRVASLGARSSKRRSS